MAVVMIGMSRLSIGLATWLAAACLVGAAIDGGDAKPGPSLGSDCGGAPQTPFDDRVAELLSCMSLGEKVSQLNTDSPAIWRLNISAFNWWQECLHGAVDYGSHQRSGTMFPQPLALAATFDLELMHHIATAISDELRAKDNQQIASSGHHMMTSCFGPNINIFRDPRWGRGSETYGEDQLLTAEMAGSCERAAGQPYRYIKVGATCKHLAAYSLEQWGGTSRLAFDAVLDPRDVADTYLPTFRAGVAGARASSLMCSYNAVNGTPACASGWLVGDTLRGEMRFGGFVVSDCGAVGSIATHHGYANSIAAAATAALRAGTDLACTRYTGLMEAVAEGMAAAKHTSKPLVVVLMHGGPLDVEWLQSCPQGGAILTAWFPGQVDMADMRMRPWPGRTHRFLQVPPLYPFGYGLSYTAFQYSSLAEQIQSQQGEVIWPVVTVGVDVSNTGGMVGEDVTLLSYKGCAELAQHGRSWAQQAVQGRAGVPPQHAQHGAMAGPLGDDARGLCSAR